MFFLWISPSPDEQELLRDARLKLKLAIKTTSRERGKLL